jgi:hypothetical protein
LRDRHANGSPEKQWTTTPFVDCVETGESRASIDTAGNHTDDECIGDTRILEILRPVVENEVDARQLLQRLQKTSGQKPLPHTTLEAIQICSPAQRELIFMICLDLGELVLDRWMVGWETAETGERSCGSFGTAGTDEVAGCFGEDEHAADEDEGPGELNRDRDSVRAGIVAVVCRIVYDGCEEETDLFVVLGGV